MHALATVVPRCSLSRCLLGPAGWGQGWRSWLLVVSGSYASTDVRLGGGFGSGLEPTRAGHERVPHTWTHGGGHRTSAVASPVALRSAPRADQFPVEAEGQVEQGQGVGPPAAAARNPKPAVACWPVFAEAL